MKIIKKAADVLIVEKVELTEPTVATLIDAERISGKSSGFEFLAAVASQVGTFDGKKLPPEELQRLSSKDFLAIVGDLELADTATLPEAPSTLNEKDASGTSA